MKALAFALCLAGSLLAGCTTQQVDDDEPSIQANPPHVNPLQLVLPLDAYRPTAIQQITLTRARNALIKACMKRFGFDYPVVTPNAASLSSGNARRYLLADPVSAAQRGYHPPQALIDASKAAQSGPTLSPAALSVVSGKGQSSYNGQAVPEGGCNGEASRRLVKGLPATPPNLSIVDELSGDSYNRSLQHTRLRAGFASWSECMKKSGYSYRTPHDANNDRVFATEIPSPQEIATAVADVSCKEETNLVGIWAAVDQAYQSRSIVKNELKLNEVKQSMNVSLRNAADVLAAG
ncbi:MAG: hypothetical protein ACM30G_19920 [Micromonosporaceae bacterium]